MNQAYIDTVRLLLAVAPLVFESTRFAMKGGTALNLFVHNLPRLSVDIDVVFTDHQFTREEALSAIAADLDEAVRRIRTAGYCAERRGPAGAEIKVFVSDGRSQVKVEVNSVGRGTLLPIQFMELVPAAQELFTTTATLPILATEELYAGKLLAAMDRQHPRDLFDVSKMFASFGLPANFVDCFVAHLAGHHRPVHEVLFPRLKSIKALYQSDFVGMTLDEVSLQELAAVQAELPMRLQGAIEPRHQEFLLSLLRLEPEWDLMPFSRLQELPATCWKLANLEELRKRHKHRFEEQHRLLNGKFEGA